MSNLDLRFLYVEEDKNYQMNETEKSFVEKYGYQTYNHWDYDSCPYLHSFGADYNEHTGYGYALHFDIKKGDFFITWGADSYYERYDSGMFSKRYKDFEVAWNNYWELISKSSLFNKEKNFYWAKYGYSYSKGTERLKALSDLNRPVYATPKYVEALLVTLKWKNIDGIYQNPKNDEEFVKINPDTIIVNDRSIKYSSLWVDPNRKGLIFNSQKWMYQILFTANSTKPRNWLDKEAW